MSIVDEHRRRLNDDERRLLSALLEADEFGHGFKAQLEHAEVAERWPYIHFHVPSEFALADLRSGRIEGQNSAFDIDSSWTHIILWVENGLLDALELAWVSEDPPAHVPSSDQIKMLPPQPHRPSKLLWDRFMDELRSIDPETAGLLANCDYLLDPHEPEFIVGATPTDYESLVGKEQPLKKACGALGMPSIRIDSRPGPITVFSVDE